MSDLVTEKVDLSILTKEQLGSLIVEATESQISQNLKGEEVVLHLDSGQYYGLNEIGTLVWNMVQTPKTVNEIKKGIFEKYEITEEVCEQDLLKLLQELMENDLIEIGDDASD